VTAQNSGDPGRRPQRTNHRDPEDPHDPATVVVMGVSGTGKSTIALGLADLLGFSFLEGDLLHSPANIEKMTRGVALTDADRLPWLQSIALRLAESARQDISTVATCSALKRVYRDVIRAAAPGTFFLHLSAPFEVLEERMHSRAGHFMPTSLLQSQFGALEPLGRDECGVVVDVTGPPESVVATAAASIRGASCPRHGT
jgi:gluconokinase